MSSSGYRRVRKGSHHWYWVAAIPAAFVLWVAALAWLALAAQFNAFSFADRVVELSMVALGIPFAFLTVYFPIAVYRDANYVNRTSGKWAPEPMRQALLALIGAVVFAVVGVVTVVLSFSPVVPIIAGFVASVPFAVHYLRKRRKYVGVPGLPWR
ncbi:hypothetical protein NGM10_08720 [Halorussus salilacus]|uniref:hypothetical protein n=1 Tax=Halorussus salilacus TaxID=2953750 RepID=UPI0020A02BBD|nr:hypothetical protein [Halorussus salilacus]USZ66814.1 hypothetical protein NGM10_08720 [Halorussus salilacus]